MTNILVTTVLLVAIAAGPAAAQSPPPMPDVLMRGVPAGQATGDALHLTLADAVARALANNLGARLEAERVRSAEGGRLRALGDLLPHVSGNVRESDQKVNLAAFGFTGFPGIPQVIGPFPVFDARIAVSTPIFDLERLDSLRAGNASLRAEQDSAKNIRGLVILVVANLYLEAIADASRVESMRSQVTTAETLYTLAVDQKASGLIAGIDVLRQQVQLEAARQRLIAAENARAKQMLRLARAIGLPADQQYELSDRIPYAGAPEMTLEAATALALAARDDVKSAQARVDAARATRKAAVGSALPSVHLDADYGALGSTPSNATGTYTVAANLHVPIFQGGATRGRIEQADSELRQREAELADMTSGVHYEVAAALLDVKSAAAAVEVARNTESLARQQLDQAQDRFRAGVSSTIELAQAQDGLATASDNYIASLYAHNVAKAALARALGVVEARFTEFIGGQR